jgi:hypothetical protein
MFGSTRNPVSIAFTGLNASIAQPRLKPGCQCFLDPAGRIRSSAQIALNTCDAGPFGKWTAPVLESNTPG